MQTEGKQKKTVGHIVEERGSTIHPYQRDSRRRVWERNDPDKLDGYHIFLNLT